MKTTLSFLLLAASVSADETGVWHTACMKRAFMGTVPAPANRAALAYVSDVGPDDPRFRAVQHLVLQGRVPGLALEKEAGR